MLSFRRSLQNEKGICYVRLCQSASDVALFIGQFNETNCLLGSYAMLKLNSVALVRK
jgi:hypothetical protein